MPNGALFAPKSAAGAGAAAPPLQAAAQVPPPDIRTPRGDQRRRSAWIFSLNPSRNPTVASICVLLFLCAFIVLQHLAEGCAKAKAVAGGSGTLSATALGHAPFCPLVAWAEPVRDLDQRSRFTRYTAFGATLTALWSTLTLFFGSFSRRKRTLAWTGVVAQTSGVIVHLAAAKGWTRPIKITNNAAMLDLPLLVAQTAQNMMFLVFAAQCRHITHPRSPIAMPTPPSGSRSGAQSGRSDLATARAHFNIKASRSLLLRILHLVPAVNVALELLHYEPEDDEDSPPTSDDGAVGAESDALLMLTRVEWQEVTVSTWFCFVGLILTRIVTSRIAIVGGALLYALSYYYFVLKATKLYTNLLPFATLNKPQVTVPQGARSRRVVIPQRFTFAGHSNGNGNGSGSGSASAGGASGRVSESRSVSAASSDSRDAYGDISAPGSFESLAVVVAVARPLVLMTVVLTFWMAGSRAIPVPAGCSERFWCSWLRITDENEMSWWSLALAYRQMFNLFMVLATVTFAEERWKLRKELELATERASLNQRVAEQRSKFLRFIFHEIRVPFNSVVLGINCISQDIDDIATRYRKLRRRAASGSAAGGSGTAGTSSSGSGARGAATGTSSSSADDAHPANDGEQSPASPVVDTELLDDLVDTIRIVREASSAMTVIINDTLEMSRIEAGAFTITRGCVDIAQLARDAITLMLPFATGKNVQIEAAIDVSRQSGHLLPRFVVADRTRLLQVATNFLSNAIKFSSGHIHPSHVHSPAEANRVTLALRCDSCFYLPSGRDRESTRGGAGTAAAAAIAGTPVAADSSAHQMLCAQHGTWPSAVSAVSCNDNEIQCPPISDETVDALLREGYRPTGRVCVLSLVCCDTGCGVRPEEVSQLFMPFVQLASGIKQKKHGTGLGLSIAKEIVVRHGGQIGVRSEADEGSDFWFRIAFPECESIHPPTTPPNDTLGRPSDADSRSLSEGSAIGSGIGSAIGSTSRSAGRSSLTAGTSGSRGAGGHKRSATSITAAGAYDTEGAPILPSQHWEARSRFANAV
jgi:signal transduction histidine kinase